MPTPPSSVRQVYKDTLRDPSSRVPLIFAGPGISPGQTFDVPVSLLDIWPTLVDIVGLRAAPNARGNSLAPLLLGPIGDAARARPGARAPPGTVVAEFHGENSNTGENDADPFVPLPPPNLHSPAHHIVPGNFMLRSGHLKLLTYGHTFPWFTEASYAPQLFNVSDDPLETTDLAAANPSIVAQMNAQLIELLGTSYEDIDAAAKANDQLVFRNYVAANKTEAQLLAAFEAQYAGWNATWSARVRTWIATSPSPVPSALTRSGTAE